MDSLSSPTEKCPGDEDEDWHLSHTDHITVKVERIMIEIDTFLFLNIIEIVKKRKLNLHPINWPSEDHLQGAIKEIQK